MKWFLGVLILLFAGCVGCSMTGTKSDDANLVDDIADGCENGLKRATVKQDDDDKEVIVECAGYGI